jgi:hypothetical protein
MKSKFQLFAIFLCLISLIQTPVFAAQGRDQDVEKLITKITARTNQLENEVKLLKDQIKQLKHQKPKCARKPCLKGFRPPCPESTFRSYKLTNVHSAHRLMPYLRVSADQEENLGAYLLHGSAVVTSPYLGERSAFDGSDLIVLNSGINQDVHLLGEEKKLNNLYKKLGQPFPANPILALSGRIETQALWAKNYIRRSQSDLNLSTVELDLVPIVNAWTTGLVSYLFDNSMTAPMRERNSRIFLNNAFLTIGNLSVTPFYGSMGQMYLPFAGQYNSFMLSSPLPQQVGQVRSRALLLGYQPLSGNGLYGALYAFRGASNFNEQTRTNVADGGMNLGFKYKDCNWSTDIGTSLVANIGNALGLQLNTAPQSAGFVGFGNTFQSERLEHGVPGVDLHSNFGFGDYRLFLEYVGATKKFAVNNLSFNEEGASPKSANIEGAYKFNVCKFPSSFAIGYARTWQAFALNLPEQRYNATFNISFLKDTILSLEYRHDINYPDGTTGGGNGPNGTFVEFNPGDTLGKTADQVTAQFGIYW